MTEKDAIRDAVANFSNWQHPWRFHDEVLSALGPEAQQSFELVWQRVVAYEHWNSPDLVACAEASAIALVAEFPALDDSTVGAIARAAAYLWR